jgi:hypothetical protein
LRDALHPDMMFLDGMKSVSPGELPMGVSLVVRWPSMADPGQVVISARHLCLTDRGLIAEILRRRPQMAVMLSAQQDRVEKQLAPE